MSIRSDVGGEQIPLKFHQYEALSFEQFIVGENQQAIDIVKTLALGQESKPLYLWGLNGTGKSHLLQAACKLASDANRTVAFVPSQLMNDNEPELLEGLEFQDLVCIDDIHLAKVSRLWQEALLHLYNRSLEHGRQLIFSSTDNPMNINIELADLKSRLSWGLSYHLSPLSDQDKILLLKQKAHQRGFDLSDEVTTYLVSRVDRELKNLLNLLDKIDQSSLSQHRKITVPFVKTLIDQ